MSTLVRMWRVNKAEKKVRAGAALARIVRKMNNVLHRINHHPMDSVVCFANTYPVDSNLFGG